MGHVIWFCRDEGKREKIVYPVIILPNLTPLSVYKRFGFCNKYYVRVLHYFQKSCGKFKATIPK